MCDLISTFSYCLVEKTPVKNRVYALYLYTNFIKDEVRVENANGVVLQIPLKGPRTVTRDLTVNYTCVSCMQVVLFSSNCMSILQIPIQVAGGNS